MSYFKMNDPTRDIDLTKNDFDKENLIQIHGEYLSGYITTNRESPRFYGSDLIGNVYERSSTHLIIKNGSSISSRQINAIIEEFRRLKEYLESIELANKLEKM